VVLEGFTNFDPLANVSATSDGALLDLGNGATVLFVGLLPNELNAAGIDIVA
jgi:hypothetical protein